MGSPARFDETIPAFIRLKKGMTARRTIISMGAAVHNRLGSGIWNSKRRSQVQSREQRAEDKTRP
jgi:hypothetical protein